MKTRACVLHAKEDIRIEEREVGAVGPRQVLVRMGAAGICGSALFLGRRHRHDPPDASDDSRP